MSVTIRLYEHPFACVEPTEHVAESVGAWLLSHYGQHPSMRIEVYRGEPSEASRITDLTQMLECEGEFTVLQLPGEPLSTFQIISLVITAISIGAQLLASPKTQPANVNRTSASPNNSLGDRSNQARPLQRIEDIYGTVLAVPSVAAPTYSKFRNNRRVEYGYYCVGRGYYSLAEIRDANSLISDVSGASASVYGPFTSPNSGDAPVIQIGPPILDRVQTVRRSDEVDGLTLKAANQINTPASATYTFTSTPTGDTITQSTPRPNFNAIATPGDSVIVQTGAVPRTASASEQYPFVADNIESSFSNDGGEFVSFQPGDIIASSGWTDIRNNRSFTVMSATAGKLIVQPAPFDESSITAAFSAPSVTYSGTREIAEVGDGVIVLVGNQFVGSVTAAARVQLTDRTDWTDWVTMDAIDQTEVSFNVAALQGMYADKGGGRTTVTTTFQAQLERLDLNTLAPTGQVELIEGSLSATSDTQQGVTLDYTPAWTGPTRARMRRSSQYDYDYPGTIVDEITWTDLLGASPLTVTQFGNVTTIQTVTLPTVRATSLRNRQLNVLASRLLPIYDGAGGFSGQFDATGRLASGTLGITSRIVDIIAAVSFDPKIGNRARSELDLAQIWGVQQQLGDLRGQFNYTFDSDTTTYEDTVNMIADAASCVAYRQSGKIRMYPDLPRATSVAQITHRNSNPNSQNITRTFANESEYDGVLLTYNDPDMQIEETIRIPVDGTAVRPKKIEVPGIRSFPQAWYRAQREYRKLMGRRLAIEIDATLDARSLLPGSRIDIVDNTRVSRMDGEVLAQNGLVLTLSQTVTFTPDQPHSIVLTRRNGTIEGIRCTQGTAPYTVVLAYAPGEPIKTTNDAEGVRTIYSFAADNVRDSLAFTVQTIDPPRNGYVTVRAANYSADFYAGDNEPVPDKYTVIN